MLKLSEAVEGYYNHSGKASDIARQLAYSAIAIVWILKGEEAELSDDLLWGLRFAVGTLALDLIQYLLLTGVWFYVVKSNERHEHATPEDIEVNPSDKINIPGEIAWLLKMVLIGACYWNLISVLSGLTP